MAVAHNLGCASHLDLHGSTEASTCVFRHCFQASFVPLATAWDAVYGGIRGYLD